MKTIQKQSGSAHIVIIVILVAAILGLLGFVFWQNFVKANDDAAKTSDTSSNIGTNEQNPSSAESVELVSGSLMTSDNFGVKYQVPNTWTGGKFGGGDTLSDSESTTLTAPDGFVIHMTISRLVRGWTQDDLTATVLEVQKNTGTELTWVVVDHANGSQGPISLQISSGQDVPTVGSKKLNASSIYKLGEADGEGVYLEIYGGYDKDMSLSEFNAKEAVKQGKAVFESLRAGV